MARSPTINGLNLQNLELQKHSIDRIFNIKHNTYPPIKTFDGITSIVKNQSNMVIRAFIWVNSITQEFYSRNIFWVLLRIFIWVSSINQNFIHQIFLIWMQVGGF